MSIVATLIDDVVASDLQVAWVQRDSVLEEVLVLIHRIVLVDVLHVGGCLVGG